MTTRLTRRDQGRHISRRVRRPALVPPSSGGVSAGLRGGAVTAALLCARSWAAGEGFWLPMKAMAAVWLGPEALLGAGATDALGLATHVAGAGALGGLFAAALGRRAGTRRALGAGLALGAALWALERWVVLPVADRTLWVRVNLDPLWWLFVDLVYGACLGAVPSLRRRSVDEVREAGPEKAATFY